MLTVWLILAGHLIAIQSVNSYNIEKRSILRDYDDLLIPSQKYCGYQHSDDYTSRVSGADITDYPWLAGLYYNFKDGSVKVNCQGTLLNLRYILTAAHCVSSQTVTLNSIRLGEYNIKNATDCIQISDDTECSDPVQEYGAEQIIIHPEYHQKSLFQSDIAIIRLNKTIREYTDYIRPICLPLPGNPSPQIGNSMITSGWGKSMIGVNAEVKKKVYNKLISNEDCKSVYNKYSVKILDTHMCTEELQDNTEFSCSGDSGGPVMYTQKAQWYIEGVSSFGSKVCGTKYPVVHTRVSKYIDWILENMKPF